MDKEIWKDIEGYEGKYQVSNFGRVKTLPHTISYTNRYGNTSYAVVPEKIRQPATSGSIARHSGYISVVLKSNNKSYRRYIHRLVAKAFIPNPSNKEQVNHKDGNKRNNRVDNLEWATPSENLRHRLYELDVLSATYKPVKTLCVETGVVYRSTTEAARILGLDRRALSHAIQFHKEYAGFHWRRI